MSEIWVKDESTQWLSRIDAVIAEACLEEVVRSDRTPMVLEVGVFRGGWTGSLALHSSAATRFFGIDPYPRSEAIKDQMLQKLGVIGIAERYRHFDSWSDFLKLLPEAQKAKNIDLVHIDGEHTQSAVQLDLEMAASVLASDGIIILDDISNPWFPGIPAAMFHFLANEDFALLLYSRTKAYICRRSAHLALQPAIRRNLLNRRLTVNEFLWQEMADQLGYVEPQRVFGADVLLCVSPRNDSVYPDYPENEDAPRLAAKVFRSWAPPLLQEWIADRLAQSRQKKHDAS